ncbi:MAG: SpoIID/LytB protein [Thermoleophilia bacterium]|nr:SpoIID/LytB protein [Thermoleophilia bacterium]
MLRRRRTNVMLVLAACAASLLVAAAPASARSSAQYRIEGGGWGHGIGLSQYGADGYAKKGWTVDRIIGHYFPGTVLAARPTDGPTSLRVLLKRGPFTPRFQMLSAGEVRHGLAAPLEVAPGDVVEVAREGAMLTATRVRGAERTPVTIASPADVTLVPAVDGGFKTLFSPDYGGSGGSYHGMITFYANPAGKGGGVGVVNTVPFESYLRGVVPAEMPAAWHPEALKSQAVAARSYALRGLQKNAPFDVYATTSSQVYGGINAERPTTDAAIAATDSLVARVGGPTGEVAQTFFYSSSGGRTANNEDVWNGTPRSYLRSVPSPFEETYRKTWETGETAGGATLKLELTPAQLGAKLGSYVPGAFRSISVEGTPSGYAKKLTIVGTSGKNTISADSFKLRFDLGSTNFRVHLLSISAPNVNPVGKYVKIVGRAPAGQTQLRLSRPGYIKTMTVKPKADGLWTVNMRMGAATRAQVIRRGVLGPAIIISPGTGVAAARR